jgi:hypothetical protein
MPAQKPGTWSGRETEELGVLRGKEDEKPIDQMSGTDAIPPEFSGV